MSVIGRFMAAFLEMGGFGAPVWRYFWQIRAGPGRGGRSLRQTQLPFIQNKQSLFIWAAIWQQTIQIETT
jgi:hypothetical protein